MACHTQHHNTTTGLKSLDSPRQTAHTCALLLCVSLLSSSPTTCQRAKSSPHAAPGSAAGCPKCAAVGPQQRGPLHKTPPFKDAWLPAGCTLAARPPRPRWGGLAAHTTQPLGLLTSPPSSTPPTTQHSRGVHYTGCRGLATPRVVWGITLRHRVPTAWQGRASSTHARRRTRSHMMPWHAVAPTVCVYSSCGGLGARVGLACRTPAGAPPLLAVCPCLLARGRGWEREDVRTSIPRSRHHLM